MMSDFSGRDLIAPGDPFFPQNIRKVRVQNPGQDIDLEINRAD